MDLRETMQRMTLEIEVGQVRFLPGALEYARRGALPGGQKNNRDFASCDVEIARSLEPEVESLLYDPQTSGGLLISIRESDAEALTAMLAGAYRIGRVRERAAKPVQIV